MRKTEKLARQTRVYRSLHKWVAVPLLAFMLLLGISGLLLGWKKQTKLLPPTQKGTETEVAWMGLDSLQAIALHYSSEVLGKPSAIDRIDIRPEKAVAKFRFKDHFTELQLDGSTGAVLSVRQRNSDLVEMIHDGSIVDYLLGFDQDVVKLAYTTITSLGLILLSVSGFWLWYNPKRIRKAKSRQTA